MATLPPPPGRLSMTIGWPRRFSISAPTARATIELEPPGAKGTTRRTGLVGQACACAAKDTRARIAGNNRFMRIPLSELLRVLRGVDSRGAIVRCSAADERDPCLHRLRRSRPDDQPRPARRDAAGHPRLRHPV